MLSPNDLTALETAVEKVRSTMRAGELADLTADAAGNRLLWSPPMIANAALYGQSPGRSHRVAHSPLIEIRRADYCAGCSPAGSPGTTPTHWRRSLVAKSKKRARLSLYATAATRRNPTTDQRRSVPTTDSVLVSKSRLPPCGAGCCASTKKSAARRCLIL